MTPGDPLLSAGFQVLFKQSTLTTSSSGTVNLHKSQQSNYSFSILPWMKRCAIKVPFYKIFLGGLKQIFILQSIHIHQGTMSTAVYLLQGCFRQYIYGALRSTTFLILFPSQSKYSSVCSQLNASWWNFRILCLIPLCAFLLHLWVKFFLLGNWSARANQLQSTNYNPFGY